MSKYYSIHEFSKLVGVSAQTLRNWDNKGRLKPHHTSTNGYRYYSEEQLSQVSNISRDISKVTVGYCRVFTQKQAGELHEQMDSMEKYLTAQGKPFKVFSDVGSGLNYNRKGLHKLIRAITLGRVDKVVILYRDSLVRFGFELIEYLASLYGCSIEIVNSTEKSGQHELLSDLTQIINEFSSKLQGKRSKKAKELLREITEEGDKDIP